MMPGRLEHTHLQIHWIFLVFVWVSMFRELIFYLVQWVSFVAIQITPHTPTSEMDSSHFDTDLIIIYRWLDWLIHDGKKCILNCYALKP